MKIAVFSTSEIQKFKGMTRNLISTGLLEKAIKLGYTIYVITSRMKFSELDDWWLSKIEKLYTGYNGYGAGDVAFIETWKQFYQDRGIDLNDLKIRRIENELSDSQIDYGTSWMEYQSNLKTFGINMTAVFILISSFIFIYLFCVWPTISDLGVFVKCIFFTMAFFGAYLVINGKMFG